MKYLPRAEHTVLDMVTWQGYSIDSIPAKPLLCTLTSGGFFFLQGRTLCGTQNLR